MYPPKKALAFLRWFCREDYLEEIEGDLIEVFGKEVEKSPRKAKRQFTWSVILYFRPGFIKSFQYSYQPTTMDMYRSYFKIGWRNLLKNKGYSLINIGGLTLGLACFIAIMLFVQHEFSYDQFFPNSERIYRVYQRQEGNEFLGTDVFAVTPAKLASVMLDEFPEVASATTLETTAGLLTNDDNNFWQGGIAADHQYFKVFKVPVVEGNAATALKDRWSIVLTRSLAKTIFGDKNPIGQSLRYQDREEYFTVTALVDDPPSSASIKYSFIINILYNNWYEEEMKRDGWNSNSYYTFFELGEGSDPVLLETKFEAIIQKYQIPEANGQYQFKDQYLIQPIADAYFQSNINFDIGQRGNIKVVYVYSAVALIVLLLACVNYMNLAIARSIKRATEVGLRKVVGAARSQLIVQFLGESVFIAFFSLMLAVGLTFAILPYFGAIVDRPIEFGLISTAIPFLFLLVLFVGMLSGSYPALIMSSLKPIVVLKSKQNAKVSGFTIQRFLIVFQFAISIALIICSLMIYRQLDFMKQKELGFEKEDVVTITLKDWSLPSKFQTLSNDLLQNPNILATTMSSHLPINISSSTLIKKKPTDRDELAIYQCVVGNGFLDVFGVRLLAGREFLQDSKTDGEESMIINEMAARALGWTPFEAVGQQVDYGGPKTIIGVVNDFHMFSMHLPIQPLLIRYAADRGRFFSLKIGNENIPETIAQIEQAFKKNSAYPFEYEFLSDAHNRLYNSEMKLGEVFGIFTLLSIVIASLGLFGLSAFMTAQRTKEVGIRKVLGASIQNIVFLVSKNMLFLVLLGFIIAIPLGWYSVNLWLRDFAYRIDMTWWIVGVAGIMAFTIAIGSIGFQSIKSAIANPVDSIKLE
nr:FtsX-like permease family protein [Cytophagales bacterium]